MEASIGDLYEAFYAQLENQDRIFEFWITMTFAVVAGTFIASEKLTRAIFVLVCTMYLTVSATLLLRMYSSGSKLLELESQLIEAGEAFPGRWVDSAASVLTVVTFLGGTAATLYFAFHTYRRSRDSTK